MRQVEAQPRKILVVEDSQSVSKVIRFCLSSVGFAVTVVENGEAALGELHAAPPDAVVLDLGLPDGKGGVVLEWLHTAARQPTGRPVWVVVSALDMREAAKRYGPLGDYFLAKPFDPWELVQLLERLLRTNGQAHPCNKNHK